MVPFRTVMGLEGPSNRARARMRSPDFTSTRWPWNEPMVHTKWIRLPVQQQSIPYCGSLQKRPLRLSLVVNYHSFQSILLVSALFDLFDGLQGISAFFLPPLVAFASNCGTWFIVPTMTPSPGDDVWKFVFSIFHPRPIWSFCCILYGCNLPRPYSDGFGSTTVGSFWVGFACLWRQFPIPYFGGIFEFLPGNTLS